MLIKIIYLQKELIYLMLLNKKRKHNKKYDYSNNNIDRSNHTYLDYLSYMHKNPNCNVWQLDFLGTIKSDSKSILSFIFLLIKN